VHMINEMPVTAITSSLFNEEFVENEYARAIKPLGMVEMAWRGYTVCNQALVDPMEAWQSAQHLESGELDSGISKSQVLYFISTRPGFNSTTIKRSEVRDTYVNPSDGLISTGSASSTCSAHEVCSRSGLNGFCCPTQAGIKLECCASSA
jgi:hypothetical protein